MYNSPVHVSPKPSVKIKTVNISLIIVVALIILAIAGGVFYFVKTREKEEKLPEAISAFNVKVGSVEFAAAGASTAAVNAVSEQDAEKIKNLTKSYLEKLFVEKETDATSLKNMFTGTSNSPPDKFIKKILQNDIKEPESVIVKGEGALNNLLIAYDKDSKPVAAVSRLGVVSRVVSRVEDDNNKKIKYQYHIKLNGLVMFEPSGTEWRFSRLGLEKDLKKYEVIEK